MPSFNPFQNVTGKHSATLFEIRLDNDIVVLRGSEVEAASQLLSGVVVICLPQPLRVEDVHLRLTGHLRVGWTESKYTASGISTERPHKAQEIFSHRFPPFVGAQTLPAGNHEWPFSLEIPGTVAESIEGLSESHLIYKLKATVARGKLAYDLHAYKPVRIIRTLDPSALEFAHAMTVENVWPNKIEYSLVIPQKAVLFGTAIECEMRFTSLLKGLKIGKIKCLLQENIELSIPASGGHPEKSFKHSREIGNWEFEIDEEKHYRDMLDESGQDGYCLNERMPLPKSLRQCMQDVDVHGIKVRHKVKFNVALHNPDGHVSEVRRCPTCAKCWELRANLPITIFISPNMPIDEQGNLVDQSNHTTLSADITAHAPPLYGQHVMDQIYADIDPTQAAGFMTPAASGVNTPFHAQSRNGSQEDLTSMDHVANSAVPPAALSHRLQNLNINFGRSTNFIRGNHRSQPPTPGTHTDNSHPNNSLPTVDAPSYFDLPHRSPPNGNGNQSSHNSSNNATGTSSRNSEEHTPNGALAPPGIASGLTSGQHTPEHIEGFSDISGLNRVPSYSTAVRTPARGMSWSSALPNYETAISAPPSPELNPQMGASLPARPAAAERATTSSSHHFGRTHGSSASLGDLLSRTGRRSANSSAGNSRHPSPARDHSGGNASGHGHANSSGSADAPHEQPVRKTFLQRARGAVH